MCLSSTKKLRHFPPLTPKIHFFGLNFMSWVRKVDKLSRRFET